MQQSSRHLRSVPPAFSTDEAPSFCSRQTPLVPASDDLRVLSMGSVPPPSDAGEHPGSARPSSRPTLASDELYRAIIGGESVEDDVLSAVVERATVAPALPVIEFPSLEAETSELTALEPPLAPVSRQRRIVARVAFMLLFGGVAALLGYAVEPRLASIATTVLAR